jgi:hypothetical protein
MVAYRGVVVGSPTWANAAGSALVRALVGGGTLMIVSGAEYATHERAARSAVAGRTEVRLNEERERW